MPCLAGSSGSCGSGTPASGPCSHRWSDPATIRAAPSPGTPPGQCLGQGRCSSACGSGWRPQASRPRRHSCGPAHTRFECLQRREADVTSAGARGSLSGLAHPGVLRLGSGVADGRGASADPVFVLCMGRSGSTLLRFLLDAHPELACPPETMLPCAVRAAVGGVVADRGRPARGGTGGTLPPRGAGRGDRRDPGRGWQTR